MTRKILINARQAEEVRVALVEGKKLIDLDLESKSRAQKKANIYKARISRIEPSLNAVFVSYGAERHGFLPAKEIAAEYFSQPVARGETANLKELLSEGQELLVQVEKEERGNKGAALTTYITLAGCYLVAMPNSKKSGGISRRIEGAERQQLKALVSQIKTPDHMGIIVRTAGLGRTIDELQWDVDMLARLWQAIQHASSSRSAPFLVYQESDTILRAVRDSLRDNISEIVVDTKAAYDKVKQHVERLRPEFVDRLNFYQGDRPLFHHFGLENQVDTAHMREVQLPSGGSIVIDHTEALTAVDINSAKANKGGDIEETAFQTNLEAADEIACQLRLRDHGGLVVIDFIDMESEEHRRAVEKCLAKATQADRARIQLGEISKFGLLEMSRQRLRPSLGEASNITCPRCSGQGMIRSTESLGLSIIRLLRQESLRSDVVEIQMHLPINVGTFLLNEKRQLIQDIEQRNEVRIVLLPTQHLDSPNYEIRRIRKQDRAGSESYQLSKKAKLEKTQGAQQVAIEQAAVKGVAFDPAPMRQKPTDSFLTRLRKFFVGEVEPANEKMTSSETKRAKANHASKSVNKKNEPHARVNNTQRAKQKSDNKSAQKTARSTAKKAAPATPKNEPKNTRKESKASKTADLKSAKNQDKPVKAKTNEAKTKTQKEAPVTKASRAKSTPSQTKKTETNEPLKANATRQSNQPVPAKKKPARARLPRGSRMKVEIVTAGTTAQMPKKLGEGQVPGVVVESVKQTENYQANLVMEIVPL